MYIMSHLISIILLTLMYIFFDNIWFMFSYDKIYKPVFSAVQSLTDLSYMKTKMIYSGGGLFAWFLLGLGLYVFVINSPSSLSSSLSYLHNKIILGLLFGFVVYGVYNGTNIVTLKNYNWNTGIYDLLWGTFVSGLITYLWIILTNKSS